MPKNPLCSLIPPFLADWESTLTLLEDALAKAEETGDFTSVHHLEQTLATLEQKALELKAQFSLSIQEAIEKLGEANVFGPQEIEATFGIKLEDVPEIPFTLEELENAETLGQMLILRVDKTSEGQPLSLLAMNTILEEKWKQEGKGALLRGPWKDCLGDSAFTTEPPRPGWVLVTKDLLPKSTDKKNYLEQTELLIETLKGQALKGLDLPPLYEEAIADFERKKADLADLMDQQSKNYNWQEAAKQLLELDITKLLRATAPETIYDLALYHDRHNDRLLPSTYSWSASRGAAGDSVVVGGFVAGGVAGLGWGPGRRDGGIGVSLSRRLDL